MMNADEARQQTWAVRERKNAEIMRMVNDAVCIAIEQGVFNTYPIEAGMDPIDVVHQLRGLGYTVKYNATTLEVAWQEPKNR